jgi:hypothetical protein
LCGGATAARRRGSRGGGGGSRRWLIGEHHGNGAMEELATVLPGEAGEAEVGRGLGGTAKSCRAPARSVAEWWWWRAALGGREMAERRRRRTQWGKGGTAAARPWPAMAGGCRGKKGVRWSEGRLWRGGAVAMAVQGSMTQEERKEAAKVCGGRWGEWSRGAAVVSPFYRRGVRATRARTVILGVCAEEGHAARISRRRADMGRASARHVSGGGGATGSGRSPGFPTQGAALSQLSRRAQVAC